MNRKRNLILSLALFGMCVYPFTVRAITVEITALVVGCGDGIIGMGEQCDGSNLGGSSCSLLGFTGGSLSCSSACTWITSSCTSGLPPSSGSGGGGGVAVIPNTNVVFTGRAYPLSRVSILKDGQLIVTTIAGPDSNFTATVSGLSTGNYTFSVYGEDRNSIRSSLFSFPIFITSGVTTKIGGIFIAPTIAVDKSQVKKGNTIIIFGQSAPASEITININSEPEFFIKKITDMYGAYILNFDTSVLEIGNHSTKSKTSLGGQISSFSRTVGFVVGTKDVVAQLLKNISLKGDVNQDNKVNLVDFSIAAFWYKRVNPPTTSDFNGDGKIDLADFSIVAFYWTG